MTNINELFSKEFNDLLSEGNQFWRDLCEKVKIQNDVPPLTNLTICKQLEEAHFETYKAAIKIAKTSLKASRLYKDIYLINKGLSLYQEEDSEEPNKN